MGASRDLTHAASVKLDTSAIADCEAQLAQVRARIAEALVDRAAAERMSQSAWRLVNQRLHGLYVLEYDIKQDLARCSAGVS